MLMLIPFFSFSLYYFDGWKILLSGCGTVTRRNAPTEFGSWMVHTSSFLLHLVVILMGWKFFFLLLFPIVQICLNLLIYVCSIWVCVCCLMYVCVCCLICTDWQVNVAGRHQFLAFFCCSFVIPPILRLGYKQLQLWLFQQP